MKTPSFKYTLCFLSLLITLSSTKAISEKAPFVKAKGDLDKKEVLQAIKKAHSWLTLQMVPNKVVKNPVRKNLILSYDHDPNTKGYKYIFSKSSLYDNALAIIAFSMVGSYDQAYKIILAMKETAPEGHFYFNYNTNNYWPNKKDRFGALTRNGASAWMGYALAYYLKLKLNKDKKYVKTQEYSDLKLYLDKVITEILKYKNMVW